MFAKTVAVAIVLVIFSRGADAQQTQTKSTVFAENVLLHVVLHEIGHAVIREFDLPILGNEETMADAFATCYLVQYLPDRAIDVLNARVTSLLIEAGEVPREQWTVRGEHNNDARCAYQIAAIALASNAEAFKPLANQLGMTDAEIRNAEDYAAEIHRSWRRVLKPLWMPEGMRSKEARMRYDPSDDLVSSIRDGQLPAEIETVLTRFDWHSQVTVSFVQGDGGAGWKRSQRTITIPTEYIRRFIVQGDGARR